MTLFKAAIWALGVWIIVSFVRAVWTYNDRSVSKATRVWVIFCFLALCGLFAFAASQGFPIGTGLEVD